MGIRPYFVGIQETGTLGRNRFWLIKGSKLILSQDELITLWINLWTVLPSMINLRHWAMWIRLWMTTAALIRLRQQSTFYSPQVFSHGTHSTLYHLWFHHEPNTVIFKLFVKRNTHVNIKITNQNCRVNVAATSLANFFTWVFVLAANQPEKGSDACTIVALKLPKLNYRCG